MKTSASNYLSGFKGIFPAKAVKPSVGLDIGVNACRMAEVINRPDGCELLRWAIEPIVGGNVVKAVKAVMAKVSQPNLFPITAVTGKGTLIRFVDMPKMSIAELKRAFSFEVDKYFPFPKDQIFTDCHILDPQGYDNKLPVLVAAAKRDLVQERIKLLSDAGFQTDFITLNSIAIANVVDVLGLSQPGAGAAAKSDTPQSCAILDVGEMVSTLTIFVDGRPRFNRDIFLGGRDYSKNLGTALKIDFDAAEKLKTQPGEHAAALAAVVDSVTVDIISELRLSFDYFATESNLSLNHFYLTGPESAIKGLNENLAKNIEMPVQVWNPFVSLKHGPDVAMEQVNNNSHELTVALGLALYS